MPSSTSSPRGAVFFDRDGVLNLDFGYSYKLESLQLLDQVPQALIKLQEAGFLLFIITNQSGVARGLYSLEDVHTFNNGLKKAIHAVEPQVTFSEILICPHHPDGSVSPYNVMCDCRKPATKLILDSKDRFKLDLSQSWLIGDKDSDVECAHRSGMRAIQMTQGGKQYPLHGHADAQYQSLIDAANHIISTSDLSMKK
jgi:D-glycero-D-manno-heptose 1,7-bisphosphate phosphatase